MNGNLTTPYPPLPQKSCDPTKAVEPSTAVSSYALTPGMDSAATMPGLVALTGLRLVSQ